jgi:ferric-dicitrate binding protein FerR (iron transport regulator)
MINDRFAQLLARHLSGEASQEETKELEVLLKEDPQAHYFYEIFSGYWSAGSQKPVNEVQEEIHFQQIIAIAEKEKTDVHVYEEPNPERISGRIITLKRLLIAATLTGITLASYFFIFQKKNAPSKQVAVNEIEAKKGARSFMLLPDGSKVWLNSDSKLEYRENFNDSIREVTLTGEAYFDVVKDAAHPFVVHTSDIDIRVLGTAFNVKAYPKESFIEATLIHGLIEVTNKKRPTLPKVILQPHEKLVFQKEDDRQTAIAPGQSSLTKKPFSIAPLPKKSDTAIVETSWIYNKLIFDGETFKEIALKMERWYNVRISFKNEKAANLRIRYQIENETIEEALKAIQVVEKFKYTINGNEIEIF